MTTVLNIAGHGLKPDGTFDPGAKGLITKGEHKYMTEDFFPAMKRHIPNNSKLKFVFYDKRNVLHYGDIVSLANSYGKDTIVIEYHYDSFTETAKGGHVIIWHKFKPDALDLRLRDVIGQMVGLRFEHMGHKGISGRDNLGNARMTANGGVNYRLLELGFGTNKENAKVMTENIDKYAKKVVEAILDTKVESKPAPKPAAKPVANKPSPKPLGGTAIFQKWLNSNYNTKLSVDNSFGPLTKKAAIKALQTEMNRQYHKKLAVDGLYGPASKRATLSVKRGARGNITRIIQGILIGKGYDPKGFDGSFGPGLEAAVKRFQKAHGLRVDGIVGVNTFTALVK